MSPTRLDDVAPSGGEADLGDRPIDCATELRLEWTVSACAPGYGDGRLPGGDREEAKLLLEATVSETGRPDRTPNLLRSPS